MCRITTTHRWHEFEKVMSKRRGWNENFAPRDERRGFPDNRCSCNGTSLDHLCRVHGNHPSTIVREVEPGECDNTRGYSPEGERDE